MNAKQELLKHIGDREVKHVHIAVGNELDSDLKVIAGSLEEVLPLLDFEYDDGLGGQWLFGHIWYADGTWSDRCEYDGSEWWEHKVCPPIPNTSDVGPGPATGTGTHDELVGGAS